MSTPGAVPTKPVLRGWLHAGMTPVVLIAGLVLTFLSPTTQGAIGAAVWTVGAVALFGTSALYHRGQWTPRWGRILRRLDHANIFVFIAASYTPLSLVLLSPDQARFLLILIWSVAVAGVIFNVIWITAPRWLSTVLYILMGWAALGWLGPFWVNGGPLIVGLIALGGVFYTVGAIVYARKRPDPSPTWFGFHEVFHACTIAAAVTHYGAIALAILG